MLRGTIVVLVSLTAAWAPSSRGQESTIPRSHRICSGEVGKRDYSQASASEVLNVVITDWMTDPKSKDDAYGYLDTWDDSGKESRAPLKRLLVDQRYVPKGFKPTVPGIQVELSKRGPETGELAIDVECFLPKPDGTIEVGLLTSGAQLVGGVHASYSAKKVNGHWIVEFLWGLFE